MRYLFLALLFVCATSEAANVKVVSSFSILEDLTKSIGGDKIEVTSLVGPDQDAHVYEPTPSDLKKLKEAQVLVMNGWGMEPWLPRLIKSSGFKGKQIQVTSGIASPRMARKNHPDPHAWHSLRHILVYLDNIEKGLSEASPENAAYFKEQNNKYKIQIAELSQWATSAFASIPVENRKVMTSHDAFGYLADDFQMQMLSPQSVNTSSEPTAKQVGAIIQDLKKNKVKAIFTENMMSEKLTKQVAKEAGAKVGGVLHADALSKTNPSAQTYLKMYRYNVEQLVNVLGEK